MVLLLSYRNARISSISSSIISSIISYRNGKWQIDQDGEWIEGHNSEDPILNCECKKVIEFCEEIGATIRNSDTKEDYEGKTTCVAR